MKLTRVSDPGLSPSTCSEDVSQFRPRMPSASNSQLALVVVWCRMEPWRVGEVLELPPGPANTAWIFGRRDPRDHTPHLHLTRRRPWECQPTAHLNIDRISRRQWQLQVSSPTATPAAGVASTSEVGPTPHQEQHLHIENLGKCVLLIRGCQVKEGTVSPGDLVELDREFLFLCVVRPSPWPTWPAHLNYPPFPFGEADAYGIVGESPSCWSLRRDIMLAAESNQHTLVLGTRGTGKELVAQAIHLQSPRASRPFITCDLSAIPEDYVSTELFGNRAGYPTGSRHREGMVSAADGGSLLLDELGDVPPDAARDLRRFLQEGEFRPLGSSTTRRVNVRVVGATNRPIEALPSDVADRFLRRIHVPPLAERQEDVALITRHLLRQQAKGDPAFARQFMAGGIQPQPGTPSPRVSPHLIVSQLQEIPAGTNVRGLQRILLEAIDTSRCRPGLDYVEVPVPPLPAGRVELETRELHSEGRQTRARVGRGPGEDTPPHPPEFPATGPGPEWDAHLSAEDQAHLLILRSYRFEIKRAAQDPAWNVSEPTAHKVQRILFYKALLLSELDPHRAAVWLVGDDRSSATTSLAAKVRSRLQSRLEQLTTWLKVGGLDHARTQVADQDGGEHRWGYEVLEKLVKSSPRT